jgi:hypothetical protein
VGTRIWYLDRGYAWLNLRKVVHRSSVFINVDDGLSESLWGFLGKVVANPS